ncbi:hypothetical protein [Rhizobium sp. BK176]|uniref:hypothetical protein n=1 Tax=Rhizobium sp. BK176 TaxID=2587071 RepID=UPI0021696DD5|nr:hypothetical protein [Rhizobium sp. BK176]MCS4088904.1 hypothetical protein [Rhizobium sp. BK176]
MDYFRNDSEAATVGGLTIENGIGSASVHGSLVLKADAGSLEQLRVLQKRLADMESALASVIEEGAFEEVDDVAVLETVSNPFG